MSIDRPLWIDPTLADPVIRYTWDDWDVASAYQLGDAALIERLDTLSRRAQTAMAIAVAEWIVFRFDGIDTDPVPIQYLEAAWAGNIDRAYCPYVEFNDEDWAGPVRGPLHIVMALINDALYFEDAHPAENAAWMCQLAEHVLPRTNAFHSWRDFVLARLVPNFPAQADDDNDFDYDWESSEPLVPREWFDPNYPVTLAMTDFLISHYLDSIDYDANPFVLSEDDLEEEA